ncbi:unnamed protein product, partial [Nesidiocoris tenuis]
FRELAIPPRPNCMSSSRKTVSFAAGASPEYLDAFTEIGPSASLRSMNMFASSYAVFDYLSLRWFGISEGRIRDGAAAAVVLMQDIEESEASFLPAGLPFRIYLADSSSLKWILNNLQFQALAFHLITEVVPGVPCRPQGEGRNYEYQCILSSSRR